MEDLVVSGLGYKGIRNSFTSKAEGAAMTGKEISGGFWE
jgi:hypothetical protein